MFFETDPAKRKEKVEKRKALKAHRQRGKRLDKARKRAEKEYEKVDPDKPEWYRISRKAFFRHRKRQMRKPITVGLVVAITVMVLYYAMAIHAWYNAPFYMALGWLLEKFMKWGDKPDPPYEPYYRKDA